MEESSDLREEIAQEANQLVALQGGIVRLSGLAEQARYIAEREAELYTAVLDAHRQIRRRDQETHRLASRVAEEVERSHALERMLAERVEEFKVVERYALSLEAVLAEHSEQLRVVVEYTRSLEAALAAHGERPSERD